MRERIAALSFLLVLVSFPSPAQEVNSVFDQQVAASELHVRRIAVIPNRLPLVLQEAEMWRQKNWEIIRRLLEAKGFDVVPYKDTVDAAKTAGLPLEDTFSSEDKFHTLCQLTSADLVIMPYYGTSFRSVNFLFLINTYIYSSIVSYQFYSPEVNLFFHRADAQGEDKFSTGWAPLIGIGLTFLPLVIPSDSTGSMSTMTSIGGIVSLGGSLYDLIQTASPPNKRWERGFERAIGIALGPFLATISPDASGWQAMAEAPEDHVENYGDAAAGIEGSEEDSGEMASSAGDAEAMQETAETSQVREIQKQRIQELQDMRQATVDRGNEVRATREKQDKQARFWFLSSLASFIGTGISYWLGSDALSDYRAATDPTEIDSYRAMVDDCRTALYATAGIGSATLLIGLIVKAFAANLKVDDSDAEIRQIDAELAELNAGAR